MPQPRSAQPDPAILAAAIQVAHEVEPILWGAAQRLAKRLDRDPLIVGAAITDVLADQILRQRLGNKWVVEAETDRPRGVATKLRLAGAELLGCSRSTWERRAGLVGGS